jgi:hypothetical protein
MASAHPVSAPVQPAPVPHLAAPPTSTPAASQAASPPSKQNLKTWWKTFSKGGPGKNQDTQGISPQLPYKPQFKEGSMSRDIFVAEDVPRWLLEEPPNASQSGRRRMAAFRSRNYRPAKRLYSFGRRVVTSIVVLKQMRIEPRSSVVRKNAKQKSAAEPNGIFGVPLRQSITYANVAISLVDADGKSYIYGYVPIVVAKCGVFLKEKGE